MRAEIEHAQDDGLVGERPQDGEIEARLGGLEGEMLHAAAVQLGKEGITGEPALHHVGVPEARVQRRGPHHALQRAVDGRQAVRPGLFGPGL